MKIDKVKLIAFVFGTIIIFLIATRKSNDQFDTVAEPVGSNQDGISKQNNIDSNSGTRLDGQTQAANPQPAVQKPPEVRSPLEQLREPSQRSLMKFQNIARLQVDFTDARFFFTDLDHEEDRVIGTYGLSSGTGESLAMLATDMKIDENLVRRFFTDYADEFPSLRKKAVRWQPTSENFGAMENSGLSDAKVWRGYSPDGLIHVAVWVPRQDQKGHYAFLYSTPNEKDLDNDGFFDSLYSKLKALPEQ